MRCPSGGLRFRLGCCCNGQCVRLLLVVVVLSELVDWMLGGLVQRVEEHEEDACVRLESGNHDVKPSGFLISASNEVVVEDGE